MRSNDGKGKSVRNPLRELSSNHCAKPSKSVKKNSYETEDRVDKGAIGRLRLVHSDISVTLKQIVEQAVKVNANNKQGRKEIESFTCVLSEIHSSIEPWVLRFQKVLSDSFMESESQSWQSLAGGTHVFVNEDADPGDESPEPSKLESLISPSPLVSWRANAECPVERSKQLFLLTPLPRVGAIMAKEQSLSKSMAFERITSSIPFGINSISTVAGNIDNEMLEGELIKLTSENTPNPIVKKTENTVDLGFVSPSKFLKQDCSLIVMTPYLKASPLKTCVLLEPTCEFSHRNFGKFRKSTPFPVGKQNMRESPDSETFGTEMSKNLCLKNPALFGVMPACTFGNGRKQPEASPAWFRSPPRTCTLMEPPDEKSLKDISLTCNHQNGLAFKGSNARGDWQLTHKLANLDDHGSCLALIECTPMLNVPESSIRRGKRPGENTLKKELWTLFEAASTGGLPFHSSLFQKNAQKGFLDRLEEASSDE
ncbi:hypothetical protein Nepgr_023999 [Nepenthes gracilis]|uniref:Uncharacterized protein n=1 Tax=Nepenthes gracilis TaxID=150966 RepID=A0AAD3Y017_NEPGR|nr:hypothetical protein Nepgr_023999 [Nepenthes gracilis]